LGVVEFREFAWRENEMLKFVRATSCQAWAKQNVGHEFISVIFRLLLGLKIALNDSMKYAIH